MFILFLTLCIVVVLREIATASHGSLVGDDGFIIKYRFIQGPIQRICGGLGFCIF